MARYTHASLEHVTPNIWSRQQHRTRWQHHRQDQHIKDTNLANQHHFWMWQHRSVFTILSCRNGIPYHIHTVKIHRWWILPGLAKPHLNKSKPPHQSHNWEWNVSHVPTTSSNTLEKTPPTTQMTTWHLCQKFQPMTIHTMFTWKSPISLESFIVIKHADLQ